MDDWNSVLEELEDILNYKFKNLRYLKEALIHDTYYNKHGYPCNSDSTINFEKLEALGDAVLDCIINSSLLKYGMERNISPYEIHHAKSNLVNNELLCKMTVFMGIHRFMLSGYSEHHIAPYLLETLYEEYDNAALQDEYSRRFFEELGDRKGTFWDHKCNTKKSRRKTRTKRTKNKGNHFFVNDQDRPKIDNNQDCKNVCINKYIEQQNPNFKFNEGYCSFEELSELVKNEYYEGPKFLADVFEAILGAVFVDGGYNSVVEVLEHILGPLV